jgi:hypothetical protein
MWISLLFLALGVYHDTAIHDYMKNDDMKNDIYMTNYTSSSTTTMTNDVYMTND